MFENASDTSNFLFQYPPYFHMQSENEFQLRIFNLKIDQKRKNPDFLLKTPGDKFEGEEKNNVLFPLKGKYAKIKQKIFFSFL